MGLVKVNLWIFVCWRWWWEAEWGSGGGSVGLLVFFFGGCWGVCGGGVADGCLVELISFTRWLLE